MGKANAANFRFQIHTLISVASRKGRRAEASFDYEIQIDDDLRTTPNVNRCRSGWGEEARLNLSGLSVIDGYRGGRVTRICDFVLLHLWRNTKTSDFKIQIRRR